MSEQPIKGLVFDMDGLLFDSERVVQKSWNEVGRQMGFGERFGDHIYHTIGFNVVRREQYFKEHVSPDFPMEEFTENTRRIYHRIMEEDGVDRKPGAEELLKYAKEHGYRLALATSSRELHAQLLLKKYGLFDYFDGAVYGNMVSAGKPDPEIYLKACASCQSGRHRQYHNQRKTDFTLRCPDPGKRHDHPRRKSRKIQIFQKHNVPSDVCREPLAAS